MRDYLDRIERFALELQPYAAQLDHSPELVAEWYLRFAAMDLHLGGSPAMPLSGLEFCSTLAALARSSGAFGFVALQQLVANGKPAAAQEGGRVGVAFGHLRRPNHSSPVWNGETVSGTVPWMTGAGLFHQVVLGFRAEDGSECFACVDAHDREEFRHGNLMDLVACRGSSTVQVTIRNLPVSSADLIERNPPGSQARADAESVLYQTPLMVGCAQACLQVIEASSRVGSLRKQRCQVAVNALLDSTLAAFEAGCDAETGSRLRARLGDVTSRLGRLAVMASGGAGLIREHRAQRLYREALV
ncbi:MAG TPA: hypothetical protein VGS41_18935, partial [Chthonomonadales bacterium]|nr:hypothetical protein [Chthonomonadales bacterium]